jgi:FAD dependent oxidoreductase
MPHELTEIWLDVLTCPATGPVGEITADVCVTGARIAGSSTAIEAARIDRSVMLVDPLPPIGGQLAHSLIGLSGNAPDYKQPTDRNFGDIFPALEPSGDLDFNRSHT